jgi:hypothetical protein
MTLPVAGPVTIALGEWIPNESPQKELFSTETIDICDHLGDLQTSERGGQIPPNGTTPSYRAACRIGGLRGQEPAVQMGIRGS